jgi:hypothetical protein
MIAGSLPASLIVPAESAISVPLSLAQICIKDSYEPLVVSEANCAEN